MSDAETTEREIAALERGVADEASLARLLSLASKPLRLRAASALSDAISAGRVAVELVERLLADDDMEVRWTTAFAANRAGMTSPAILDAAVAALDLEDGDVRWAAAGIITRAARQSAELCDRLRALAANGSARSRKMALLCLCDSGAADRVLFRRALADEDPFVRLAAVTSIARCGDASNESLAALKHASETDDDVRVQRGAAAILARLSK